MSVTIRGTDNSASTPAVTGTDGDTGVFFPAVNTVAVATNGTEKARFDSSGNLLIGTTSTATGNGANIEVSNSLIARLILNQTGTRRFSLGSGSNSFNVYDETADAERLKIDSSGRVLTPFNPAFAVSNLAHTTGNYTGGTVYFDTTSSYNSGNGRFTAPVTGNYIVGITVYVDGTSTCEVGIYKNGSVWAWLFQKNYTGGSFEGFNGSQIVSLAAGDYINWYNNKGATRPSNDDHRWVAFLG
jgi:hypothetical protein